MEDDYVSSRPNGYRDYCGIGNVVIPQGVDPINYIANCYRTGVVSIVLENGGIVDNVILSISAIKDIQFPDGNDYKKLGSQVLWINKPRQNQPIVIGVFNKNNEFVNISQYSDSLGKPSNNGVAEIMVDSNKGIIVVNCSSSVESGGDIYIISTNKSQNSQLKVKVSGQVTVETPIISFVNKKQFSVTIKDTDVDQNTTLISYEKGVGLSYSDEFGNELFVNKDNVQIKPIGVLNIGEGEEPLVLGNKLKSEIEKTNNLLKALLTIINGNPIPEPGNGLPSALQTALKTSIAGQQLGSFEEILSKIANTD